MGRVRGQVFSTSHTPLRTSSPEHTAQFKPYFYWLYGLLPTSHSPSPESPSEGLNLDDSGRYPGSPLRAANLHGLLPSNSQFHGCSGVPKADSYFHLHLVSDATGETLLAVGRAACAQYSTVSPIEHVYPLIRNIKQLDPVLTDIEINPGIVLYTLVDPVLTDRLENHCKEKGIPCLSILNPVLGLFASYLGT